MPLALLWPDALEHDPLLGEHRDVALEDSCHLAQAGFDSASLSGGMLTLRAVLGESALVGGAGADRRLS